MGLFSSTPKRRKSKKLKTPKRNATVKQLETYARKMTERVQKDKRRKELLAFVDKVKNYTFS